MTEEQKAARAAKARARAQAWRDRVNADPERAAAEKARHAARCRESRRRFSETATAEERQAAREAINARQRRNRVDYMARPEVRARIAAQRRAWAAANQDKVRAARNAWRGSQPVQIKAPLAGSVLAASVASPARDVLAAITAMIPAWHTEREDIIGEAVLMTLEGVSLRDAVKAARSKVAHDIRPMLQSIQVEECRWL